MITPYQWVTVKEINKLHYVAAIKISTGKFPRSFSEIGKGHIYKKPVIYFASIRASITEADSLHSILSEQQQVFPTEFSGDRGESQQPTWLKELLMSFAFGVKVIDTKLLGTCHGVLDFLSSFWFLDNFHWEWYEVKPVEPSVTVTALLATKRITA